MVFVSDESAAESGFKFTFEFELTGPDPCESNPCQHDGECQSHPDYYTCKCADGFAGINCEIDMDECASYPCKHGGTCVDGVQDYTCDCLEGFTGKNCETPPDFCASNPCENGGLCVNRNVDFVCSCPRDFMGEKCEEPVPTPSPPPTPAPTTPAPTQPEPTEPAKNEPVPEVTTQAPSPTPKEDKKGEASPADHKPHPPGDANNHKTSVIIAVILVLLVLLLLLGIFLWYWFKLRKGNPQKREKEVTLINMKTKSEHGQGRSGHRLSRTTSINSVTMKGDSRDGRLLNKLKKMSEDIIMEEVPDETKNRPPHHIHPSNPYIAPVSLPNTIPDTSNLRKISIPVTQHELNGLGNHHMGPFQPTNVAPHDAIELLNQLKQNNNNNMDFKSALSQYGIPTYTPKPFPSYNMAPLAVANVANPQINPFQPEPYPTQPSYPTDPSYPTQPDHSMELSAQEAAEVVNHLLRSEPNNGKPVTSQEAMEIIRHVRDKSYGEERPPMDREKSIVLHPHEVANIFNKFRNRPTVADSDEPIRNEGGIASSYDPSDPGDRAPNRMNREFRECSPIQEESSGGKQGNPRNAWTPEADHEEPVVKRVRKKPKRFLCESSIDPDQKVHDWLESTPKVKGNKHKKHRSPVNSVATDTVITRTLPTKVNRNGRHSPSNEEPTRAPRTIRQTRRMIPDKSMLPITGFLP
ncbi:uncharacterized protein LOC100176063 isoform X2 [Ciona intestinalis]